MSSNTKRSLAGSKGQSSKRAKHVPVDTLRFQPRNGYEAMFSSDLVQYYTQVYGQNLFMLPIDGHIDVKFVDAVTARCVWENVPDLNPPFIMKLAPSIDLADIQVKSPGRVTLYQAPNDVDHYDATPCVPHASTNPFPIKFEAPESDATEEAEEDNPEGPVRRPPRLKPVYPRTAQPPAPSPRGPFVQPKWPLPDSILSPRQ